MTWTQWLGIIGLTLLVIALCALGIWAMGLLPFLGFVAAFAGVILFAAGVAALILLAMGDLP